MTLPRGRPAIEPDTTTYSGMISARVRELRIERGWTIQEVQERLLDFGVKISTGGIYAWERGAGAKGSDVPAWAYPMIAWIYGYKTPAGWLPTEWPQFDR